MSIQIIEYDPQNPSGCSKKRSGADASSRANPYSRDASARGASSSRYSGSASLASTSFISPDEAQATSTNVVKRLVKDFSQAEQIAITWTKRRAVLNSVTTSGWLRHLTDKEKSSAEEYVAEIIGQANLKFASKLEATSLVVNWVYKSLSHDRARLAKTSETLLDCHNLKPSNPNLSLVDRQTYMESRRDDVLNPLMLFTYYLHGCVITATSVFVLLFANPGVEETHLDHWYRGKYSPLRDEDMRNQLKTTPTRMLAMSATAVILAILRALGGNTSGNMRFTTDPHADYQEAVHQAILQALASPIHGPALALRLLALHEKGLKILRGALGLDVAVPVVQNPVTAEDSEIVLKALQHAQATGLLSGQGHHNQPPQTGGHYSTPIFIPSSLDDLTLPRADIAPPATLHQALMAQSSTANFPPAAIDPILLSAQMHVMHDFGDDFLEFTQGHMMNKPGYEGDFSSVTSS